jgi:hypothetical protein
MPSLPDQPSLYGLAAEGEEGKNMTTIINGSATVAAGSTFVDVTHGAPSTPDINTIQLSPQDDLGGRDYWPSNVGAVTFRININSLDLADHVFGYVILYEPSAPLGTGINTESDLDIVRKRVGLSGTTAPGGLPDADVKQYLAEAATWLSSQIDDAIDHTSCDEEEAEAVRNLAAIKCYYQVTGTSSTGWTANIGPISFSGAPDKIAMLKDLWALINAFIKKHKASDIPFKAGSAQY